MARFEYDHESRSEKTVKAVSLTSHDLKTKSRTTGESVPNDSVETHSLPPDDSQKPADSAEKPLIPGVDFEQTPCLNGFGRPELQPQGEPDPLHEAEDFAVGIRRFLWSKKELTVCFLDDGGIPGLKQEIERIAKQWEAGTSLRLNFLSGVVPNADIRITLKPTGMFYSVLGTAATFGSTRVETMSLGFRPGFTEYMVETEKQRLILHEFGHALGLDHEFKRNDPNNRLVDINAAVQFFKQNGLRNYSEADIRAQFERLRDSDYDAFGTEFDPKSIMMYPLPAQVWPPSGMVAPHELSEGDKAAAKKMFGSGVPAAAGPGGLELTPGSSVKKAYYLFGTDTALFHFWVEAPGTYRFRVNGEISHDVIDPYARIPLEHYFTDPLLALGAKFEVFPKAEGEKLEPAVTPISGSEFQVRTTADGRSPSADHSVPFAKTGLYFVKASIASAAPNQPCRFVIQLSKA